MPAFDSSFLDNPFEAELTSTTNGSGTITIPQPIAPARPATTVGNTIPSTGMWNGQPISGIDQGGNVYGTSGQILGTIPSSSSSSSTTGASSSAGTGRAAALGVDPSGNPYVATSPGGYSNSVTTWIQAHIEDFVFIIIGILLIAAGAAALGFESVQTGASKISPAAGKAVKFGAELAA